MLNELFTTSNPSTVANSRSLPGSLELTSLSGAIANEIIMAMNDNAEEYTERIKQSTKDSAVLDQLIVDLMPELDGRADFLKELADDVIDSMLKSQQSKRSRCKSKAMTLDNYKSYMSAAIAEKIIRDVTGREKVRSGFGGRSGGVDYTGAQLEAFAEDQEALRREIRNVQSKKSIMKSKADFSESDERWLALLKAEQQLKDLRVTGGHSTIVEVDTTKNAINELLAGVDISKLNSKEAHALLMSISGTVVEDDADALEEIEE